MGWQGYATYCCDIERSSLTLTDEFIGLNTPQHQQKSTAIKYVQQLCASLFIKKNRQFEIHDIKHVVDCAVEHRVVKAIDKAIKEQNIPISEKLSKQFNANNKKTSLRMLFFSSEISLICQELAQHSITAIPLKGPIAAKQIYDDFTAKNSRDIDLLVPQGSLESTIQLIEQKGYTCKYTYHELNPKQQSAFQRINNQLSFIHSEKKIQLEIHWRLFANPYLLPISFDELVSDSSTISVSNRPVIVLSSKHLLFYLCAHGAKHHWALLYWLLELATLIRKESYSWEKLLQEAIDLGIERPLVQGVILVEKHLEIQAPSVIKTYYQRHKTIQQLVEISSRVLKESYSDFSSPSISNYLQILSYKMKLRSNLRYKLAYWNTLSIKDFELVKLPQALFFGYFWLRPVFWLWRYLVRPTKTS